ncbi:MAG: S8/S53 family peptidase [Hamadaea sp.]|nr:S8/S53 family peptidase [Hamadaea sp.]
MSRWYVPEPSSQRPNWPTVDHLNSNVDPPARTQWQAGPGGVPAAVGEAQRRVLLADVRPRQDVEYVGLPAKRGHVVDPFGAPAKEGHTGVARLAVAVPCYPPARRADATVPGGRRPVVAVLDTGVGDHPWFGDGGRRSWIDARDLGWTPRVVLPPRADGDVLDPDGLDSHAGHGTFITGLIRQVAPDADVISLQVMRTDGSLDEDEVLAALEWILDRVRTGDAASFVDVVSLSFGYFEQPGDEAHTAKLGEVLGELGALGVRVVASAGNHKTDAPVYPAAFAGETWLPKPAVPLISLGALNPDGAQASYSNFGGWVSHWDIGTSVISTLPRAFGSTSAPAGATDFDGRNFGGGFARWGGTSFSAASFAGRLARALTDQAVGDSLTDIRPAACAERAARALARAEEELAAYFHWRPDGR